MISNPNTWPQGLLGSSRKKQKTSEYDQEMPQSQTADQPTHREEETENRKPRHNERKGTSSLSLSAGECWTRKNTKNHTTKQEPSMKFSHPTGATHNK